MPSASSRTTDSMTEFTRKMLHTISDAKAAPDIDDQRDMPFLIDLETTILSYLREPLEAQGLPTGAGSPMGPEAQGLLGAPPSDTGASPGLPPELAGPGAGGPGLPSENMAAELRRAIR